MEANKSSVLADPRLLQTELVGQNNFGQIFVVGNLGDLILALAVGESPNCILFLPLCNVLILSLASGNCQKPRREIKKMDTAVLSKIFQNSTLRFPSPFSLTDRYP